MKKFIRTFLAVIFAICCFGLIGCGDKYDNLKFSLSFSISQTDIVEPLSDGTKRVKSTGYSFDEKIDGNYTFYLSQKNISQSNYPKASLKVSYSGYPNGFNFSSTVSSSNVEVLSCGGSGKSDSQDVYVDITLIGVGQSELTVLNNETGRTKTIYVDVQPVASELNFTETNLALANVHDDANKLNLLNYLSLQDKDSLSFQFGKLNKTDYEESQKVTESNFETYNLETYGLTFDKTNCTLSLDKETNLESIDVVATYTNPLGEDLQAVLTVRFLNNITNFVVYKGKSFDDATTNNIVTMHDFYANLVTHNYVDLVLTAKTNGEKVSFDVVKDSKFPFSTNIDQTSIVYLDKNNKSTTDYNQATTAYQLVHVTATKNTEDTTLYGSDRSYPLVFECNYASYDVPNYPLKTTLTTKAYDLVKGFKVNGQTALQDFSQPLAKDIYRNSSDDLAGESFFVEIDNQPTILQDNSKFTLEFTNIDGTTFDITGKLVVSYKEKNSQTVTNLTNDNIKDKLFDKDTTFYVKPTEELREDTQIYMTFKAQKPKGEQAVAFCLLTVKEGLKNITAISYTYTKFVIDSDNNYELNTDGSRKTISVEESNVGFDENFECNKTINLDGDISNNQAIVSLTCDPAGATLDNLSIVSSDPSSVVVTWNKGEKSFIIEPVKIYKGTVLESEISISASNLKDVYKIKVKVFSAINALNVELLDPSATSSVTKGESDMSAKVEYGKRYYFAISTQPVPTSYEINYSLYKNTLDNTNLIKNMVVGYSSLSTTIGDTNSYVMGDNNFSFDVRDFGFTFVNYTSDSYILVMSIINANGSIINKTINLSSYVPIGSMVITNLKDSVKNANKIYYANKVQKSGDSYIVDAETLDKDDSIFGIKVETSGKDGNDPTYSFANNGFIEIYVNDVLKAYYSVSKNGMLSQNTITNSKDDYITKLNDGVVKASDGNDYYVFRLNENFTSNVSGSILVTVGIKQFEGGATKTLEKSTRISITPVKEVQEIKSSNTEINYRKGETEQTQISVSFLGTNIHNDKLLTRVVASTKIGENTYYFENDSMFSLTLDSFDNKTKNYLFDIQSSFVGSGYVLFVPQDKVTTLDAYNKFFNFEYVKFENLSESDFVEGQFYCSDSTGAYVIAQNYQAGTTYYLRTVKVESLASFSQNMAVVNFTVSDGKDMPYYISTLDELKAIGKDEESVTRNYVLTKDLEINMKDFAPIGNYYQISTVVDEDSFENKLEPYYTKNSDGTFVEATKYVEKATYYAYGFGGTLSGKYTIKNINGEDTYKYYGFVNIKHNGTFSGDKESIFARIGENGEISDLALYYDSYNISLMTDATLAGLAIANYGKITNVSIKFSTYKVTTSSNLTLGGIVGENYGLLENTYAVPTTGEINVNSGKDNAEIIVGGFVGKNYGKIVGFAETAENYEIAYDDLGFDCNIVLNIQDNSTLGSGNSNIGVVAGYCSGTISNFSANGRIIAPSMDNVGGLVGKLERNENLGDTEYSIKDSYSIAHVEGRYYVGGAVGKVQGIDSTHNVTLNNVSAENYDTQSYSTSRLLVKGSQYVGGLIGHASYLDMKFSYVKSYYDLSNQGYDVQGSIVGGLIGYAWNVSISQCATYVNVETLSGNGGLFVASCSNTSIQDVFAYGYGYGNGFATNFLGGATEGNASRYIIAYVYNSNKKSFDKKETSIGVSGEYWATNTNTEDEIKYFLVKDGNPLMSISPTITVSVKTDSGEDTRFLDASSDKSTSVVLFLAEDTKGLYSAEQLESLNTIDVDEFLNIVIPNLTYKTSKISVTTYEQNGVLQIQNGKITLCKTGSVTLKIFSKLSSVATTLVNVYVMSGASDVKLYTNDSTLYDLSEIGSLSVIKNSPKSFYTSATYTRTLNGKELSFDSTCNKIGVRFKIYFDDIPSDYTDSLDQMLTVNGQKWDYNTEEGYQYIDVEDARNITFLAKIAYENLSIHYVPFIKDIIGDAEKIVFLEEERYFALNIQNGATEIFIKNNIDTNITMNQLEKFTLTVVAYTDVVGDEIVFVSTPSVNNSEDMALKCSSLRQEVDKGIAYTFTFFYANKLEPLKENLVYNIKFYAKSNEKSKKEITLTILPQKNLKTIITNIYSELDKDFPQSPSQNNVIYNGRMALMTLETYPYLADYSNLRIRYLSTSTKTLTITQLEYNSKGTTSGNKFSLSLQYGTTYDSTGALIVTKESAQDVYLYNDSGVYSYSRFMFFGLLVPSDTLDGQVYYLYIDVLDSKGNITLTQMVAIKTLSKTSVELKFDDKFKGQDGVYYLPVNTKQKLDVITSNIYQVAEWEVTSNTNLTSAQEKIFVPYLENGSYYVNIMNFAKNEFSTDLIGKKITLTLTLDKGITSDTKQITFVLSLFTVTNITAGQVTEDYLTLVNATTTPLLVDVEACYDESVTTSANNWYSQWYDKYIESTDGASDSLYKLLTNSGYTIKENFAEYITALQEKITKASYNSKSTEEDFTSGVWFYKNSEGTLSALKSGSSYNNNTFGVEIYNSYVAVCGYQEDTVSDMSLYVRLSLSSKVDGQTYLGVPNVENYNYDTSIYASAFNFTQNFVLSFVSSLSFYNPTPVASVEEFLALSKETEGDFRLISDLILTNYTPFEAKFKSFDGNNYKIFITSFADPQESATQGNLGLFTSISQDTMVCNTTVVYTSKVEFNQDTQSYVSRQITLSCDMSKYSSINFGGLASTNNGVITNCKVTGIISLTSPESSSSNYIGGLVAGNTNTGYITNSKVQEFKVVAYGQIGGVVHTNSGMIVSSYFDSSEVENLAQNCNVGGFAYQNTGSIAECYVQGSRASTDAEITNTGTALISQGGGNIGAFVYSNESIINDCYVNIFAKTANIKSGFVYQENSSSVISRCYSIFYREVGDNASAIYPFIGPKENKVVVNGTLNNCYYLISQRGNQDVKGWASENFYVSTGSTESASQTPDNKKAFGLEASAFSTHDNFVNFDMSLTSNTVTVAYKQYYYVDGYTWAIIEGRPLLVSTLTDTISMHTYVGKKKNYKMSENVLFNLEGETELYSTSSAEGVGNNLTLTKYYIKNSSGKYTDSDIIYTSLYNASLFQYTFNYPLEDGNSLTIVAEKSSTGLDFVRADYGDGTKQILDIKVLTGNTYVDSDNNFRANDTIFVDVNEDSVITKIVLKELQSVSYYYSERVKGVSDLKGTRTNPYLLYDYESFANILSENTDGKFYRLVRNIDFGNVFVKTSSKTFSGVLQGNHMTLSNLAISYFNDEERVSSAILDDDSFGLFAEIATSTGSSKNDTVVSDLNIVVQEVISNSHKYVGALAGKLVGGESSKKIFLNNINIIGEGSKYIAGKNAVGGLAGYATGNVIIKDINCSVSVNATYNAISDINAMLYISNGSMDKLSYAGGIVGIFDVTEVVDPSTLKNYNANNITIDTTCIYQGNIVGGAFGLVGTKAIVNYVNITYSLEDTSFIKSMAYAGGLVGENRGRIISSSVKYVDQDKMIQTLYPEEDESDSIFFASSSNTILGLGGLVGLNNGGFIANSITTINVRNETAVVVGGAVGRMVGGGLVGVVATGAVLGGKFVGGLIGTINDKDILVEAGYNKSAFIDFTDEQERAIFNSRSIYVGGANLEENVTTLISSCIAGNNYLSDDYRALSKLYSSNDYAFAGFIGLIAFYSSTDTISANCEQAIKYGNKSYFVDKLYKSSSDFKYLNSTYYSPKIDAMQSKSFATNILKNGDTQMVYPYSVQDFYYEAQDPLVSYAMKSSSNTQDKIKSQVGDVVVDMIYEFVGNTPNAIKNSDELYTEISYDASGNWATSYENRKDFDWYKLRFGVVYYKQVDGVTVTTLNDTHEAGTYIQIQDTEETKEDWSNFYIRTTESGEQYYPKIYYLSNRVITNFEDTKTYTNSTCDMSFTGVSVGSLNGYTFYDYRDILKQKYALINGIQIPLGEITTIKEVINGEGDTSEYIRGQYKSTPNLLLPNGSKITQLVFNVEKEVVDDGTKVQYVVEEVVLTYSITNIPYVEQNSDQYEKPVASIYLSSKYEINQTARVYNLKVSSKGVIYKAFDNGYWTMDNYFYADDFDDATKYPTNLEIAETYIWSKFASSEDTISYINSAEDLAKVANDVNSGKDTYKDKTLILMTDIDLSGKYWIPIGTEECPFEGTFNGNNMNIQYVSVNQNSSGVTYNNQDGTVTIEYNNHQKYLDYAGLFGVIKNAEIVDLNILGGEVVGKIAGGLVGKAIDSTISNIFNRNSAVGLSIAGGIVGEMVSSDESLAGSSLTTCTNDAGVSLTSNTNTTLYIGGLVGKVDKATISGNADNYATNSGKISVNSTYNSYVDSDSIVYLYVGGIVGKATNSTIGYAQNTGNIEVKTNAHKAFIGGAIGDSKIEYIVKHSISNLKNNGQIVVEDTNSFQSTGSITREDIEDSLESSLASFDVGGVVGRADNSLKFLSNLASIDFEVLSSTFSYISIGGVVGRLKNKENTPIVEQSYNSGNISSSSTNSSIFGIGGIVGAIDLGKNATTSVGQVFVKDNYNSATISSNNSSTVYEGGIVGYVYNTKIFDASYVYIQNNINVGLVIIYDIVPSRNALGAIVGDISYCFVDNSAKGDYKEETKIEDRVSFDLNNYYLAGCAYSSNIVYTGYTCFSDGQYKSVQENFDDNFFKGKDNGDVYFFSKALSSSDLKLKSSYEMRKKTDTETTTWVLDFDKVWNFKHETWYPTLKNNQNTSYWVDNTKEIDSSTSTYLVSSAEELAYMARKINSGEIDSKGITIKLTKSIDLSNKYFTPIGTSSNPFKGTFDGRYYEIKNLTVSGKSKYYDSIGNESFDDEFGGLFGVVKDATIKNVGLESPIVQDVSYAGGIVAQATNSSLVSLYTDCSQANLSSSPSKIRASVSVGGIVGVLSNSKDNGDAQKGLYNSYNNVYVQAGDSSTYKVGGLVGEVVSSNVYNCYNNYYGLVTVANAQNQNYQGGVVIGKIDSTSEIVNIFNLSPRLYGYDNSSQELGTPALYYISEQNVVTKGQTQPTFANLVSGEGYNFKKEDLWAKEYSLNPSAVATYPSLSGLNREWKNSPSEALVGFDYDSGNNKKLVYNYIDSVKNVYNEDGTYQSGKFEDTLANFAKDSISKASVSKVYLITCEEDLVWLANSVNDGTLITSNMEFMLVNDLDFSGRYFSPIGKDRTNSFCGVFNFNGHVIKGITIDSNYTYSGLFGYTQNAIILNGYLMDTFIKINASQVEARAYSGSIVGFAENTTIKNMVVSSCISATTSGGSYVGGVVGYYTTSDTTSMIKNVRVYGGKTADIDKFTVTKQTEDEQEKTINMVTEGSIGSVNLLGYSSDGGAYVGGVVGYAVETVDNQAETILYATVDAKIAGLSTSSLTTANVCVGGVLGYGADMVTIKACQVEKSTQIKSYSNRFDSVGGIVGTMQNGSIKDCKVEGYVEPRVSSGREVTSIQIWSYVGGIVGILDGADSSISSCYSLATTTTRSDNKDFSAGAVIGLARNRSFLKDSLSIYTNDQTNGFAGSNSNAIIVGQQEKAEGDYTLIYSNNTGDMTQNNGFDSIYWSSGTLLCKKVFVMGGGTYSFTVDGKNKNLITPDSADNPAGVEIDLDQLSTLNLQGVNGKIGLAYITKDSSNDLSYVYKITNISDSEEKSKINVSSHLDNVNSSDPGVIVIFVTKK